MAGNLDPKRKRKLILDNYADHGMSPGDALLLIKSAEFAEAADENEVLELLAARAPKAPEEAPSADDVTLDWADDKTQTRHQQQRAALFTALTELEGDAHDHVSAMLGGIDSILNSLDDGDGSATLAGFRAMFASLAQTTVEAPVQLLVLYLDRTHGDLTLYGFDRFAPRTSRKGDNKVGDEAFRELGRVRLRGLDDVACEVSEPDQAEELGISEELLEELQWLLFFKATGFVRAAVARTFDPTALGNLQLIYPLYVYLELANQEWPPGDGDQLLVVPEPPHA